MVALLVRTLLIYVVIVLLLRLMGKRQLGELQPSELVSTILLSNLASICIEDPRLPITASLVPVILIAALELTNSLLCFHFAGYARFLCGRPITVIRDGKIDQRALHLLCLSASDLMDALRGKDLFDPGEVYWGVVETNGQLSAAPMPQKNAPPPLLPLVIDGIVFPGNLQFCQRDSAWLGDYLAEQNTSLQNVLLLLGSPDGRLVLDKKEYSKAKGPQGGAAKQ